MTYRIFQVGSRVELRGLDLQDTGTVIKIGRLRATVKCDTPVSTLDARGRKKRPAQPYAFLYKNLRII